MSCQGGPEYVIANGRVAVDEGQVKAVQGYGTFLPTPAFSPFVYDAVSEREQVHTVFRSLICRATINSFVLFFRIAVMARPVTVFKE